MPIPLPIDSAREQILEALSVDGSLVLSAPTGSGKSTRVPPMLLDRCSQPPLPRPDAAPPPLVAAAVPTTGLPPKLRPPPSGEARWGNLGKVLVLQPRRLATRLVATRVAEELGCPLGGLVGFRTRHEGRSSPDTRILYVTQGLFLRMLLDNPRLDHVSAVVLDEFHERHLDGDLALAMAVRLRRTLRPDLRLVVMSATLDVESLSTYLDCPVVQTSTRTFPVDIRFGAEAGDRPPWELASAGVRSIVQSGEPGDILVFMPGGYEIRRTLQAVSELRLPEPIAAFPLHGELPVEEQDRALGSSALRKVIVATNVAETSITIPGVRHVVDSGLARVARHDPRRGINTLVVQKISRASADQRAGRAGRTAPGTCRRLWSAYDHQGRPEHESPEVHRIDLSQALLLLSALGADLGADFPWLTPPHEAGLSAARDLLTSLGALAADGRVTDRGRLMAEIPAHPRLSRMIIEGELRGCREEAALVAALLSERTLLRAGARRPSTAAADDLSDLLDGFHQARDAGFDEAFCRTRGISSSAARQVDRTWNQLRRSVGKVPPPRPAAAPPPREGAAEPTTDLPPKLRPPSLGEAGRGEPAPSPFSFGSAPHLPLCLLAAFPDHVAARSKPGSPVFALTRNRRAVLAGDSACADCDLLVAGEITEIGTGSGLSTVLSLLVPLRPDDLLELFCEQLSQTRELQWNREAQIVEELDSTRFFDLSIEETRKIPSDRTTAARLLARRIVAESLHLSGFDDKVDAWVDRLRFVSATFPEKGLPAFDSNDRLRAIEILCGEDYRYARVKDRPALDAVRSLLSAAERRFVEEMAPERLQLPRGHRMRIAYPSGQRPTGRARIQDLYDLHTTPRIAGGRVPLLLEITGPNNRPLQVTDDLSNFWKVLYPQLKNQLQRRYPKHEWR